MPQYTLRNISDSADRDHRLAGSPIPTNDLWIAALVVEHDVMLYSRDARFDALPQLPMVRST